MIRNSFSSVSLTYLLIPTKNLLSQNKHLRVVIVALAGVLALARELATNIVVVAVKVAAHTLAWATATPHVQVDALAVAMG